MKCNKCGNEVQNTKFCPYCGNMVNSNMNANNSNNNFNNNTNPNNPNNSKDDINLVVGILLTVFSPIVGIIFCLVMLPKEPRLKKVLYFAVGLICITLVSIAFIIITALSGGNSIDIGYDNDELTCSNYCSSSYVIEGNTCVCEDGRTYELYKNEENNNNNSEDNKTYPDPKSDPKYDSDNNSKNNDTGENYVITEFNKDEWLKLTSSDTYVINVIAASWCPHCQNFKPMITEAANKTKTKLYFIETDKIAKEDYDIYTKTYTLNEYSGGVPHTFVTRNGKVLGENSGEMDLDATLKFINSMKQYM